MIIEVLWFLGQHKICTKLIILKFEAFLKAHKPVDHHKPMGNNTVMKHIARFRKVIALAHKLDWIEKDPFINFNAKFDKVEQNFLSEKELFAIEDKYYSIERIRFVRDMFVFACYTGLSYIDKICLEPSDVLYGIDGELWIVTYRRKKTTH